MDNKPWGYERRRQADRRSSSRGGKFERRKNTCGNCLFYKPQSETSGVCQKHQSLIRATDFACIWFTSGQTPPEPPPVGPSRPT